jgi:hypothetical protein
MPPGASASRSSVALTQPRRAPVASLALASAVVSLGVLAVPNAAYARPYVVEERVDEESDYESHSHLDLAFDGEGAIPLGIGRSPSGNDVNGGGGFKIRVGDQIRFPHLRLTPELGYGYDHLFATDASGDAFAWDMHRLFAGARVGFGRIIVPTVYAHVGYGWRNTGDPSIAQASGLALDAGFALDLHLIPHLGIGAHAEYAMIDAQPFTPQWLAIGLHADVAF